MKELSLHILDIFNNSLAAEAGLIALEVDINEAENYLSIRISDDGCGMDAALAAMVEDPFTTTRTTRKVGLGLPLFKQAALASGGEFHLESTENVGTLVYAKFVLDSIDRMPLGDMPNTIAAMVMPLEDSDLVFTQRYNEETFTLDTRELREILGSEVSLAEMAVLSWIRDAVEAEYAEIGCDLRSF